MGHKFWDNKRVLVTGHTGFKGGWLMCVLHMLGAKPFGFSKEVHQSPSAYDVWIKHYGGKGAEYFGDIADFEALHDCVKAVKPDIILHLAAQSLVLQSYDDPIETVRTNILGTANVLECCRIIEGIEALIVVTTDKVYKVTDAPKAFNEDDALGGKDLYSSSKACCELVTQSYHDSFFATGKSRTRIATVRAGNVVGGGDWSDNRLIPDLVRAHQSGRACLIRNPHSTRPWQHVLEPLSGYFLLAEKMVTADSFTGAWNFGPHAESVHNVHEVARQVSLHLDGLHVEYGQEFSEHKKETDYLAIDSAKARDVLGWSSKLSFEDTIAQTCAWYKSTTDEDRKAITEQQISNFFKI